MSSVSELAREFATRERAQRSAGNNERQFFEDVIDVRLEQFTEAVALLLVSDHTEEVLPLLGDPAFVLEGHSRHDSTYRFGQVGVNIRQFVGLSLFAALARQGGMHLGETGLEYVTSQGLLVLAGELHSEREFFAVLPTLLFIAIAREIDDNVLYYLSTQMDKLVGQYGTLGLLERPEGQLFEVYRTFFKNNALGLKAAPIFGQLDAFIGLRELERRYTNRIREMRNDRYHWVRMNAPGDLIDWVLLIAQVAMLRRDGLPFLLDGFPVPPEIQFCWDLARTFA
jgi:hypothetical protein